MIGNWKVSNSIISRRIDNRDVADESFIFTTSYFPCTIKVYIFLSSLICILNTSPVTTVTLSVELQIAYLFYHYVIFFSRKDDCFIKTHFLKKHKFNEMNFGKCNFLSVINTIWKMWNKFININCILTHTIYVLSYHAISQHKSEI